jgi:hypothetical protein
VAVQVGSPEKPVTVNDAGVASEALAEAGVADPLAQESDTVTDPPAFGTKSLLTVKVALVSVFVIVQDPVEKVAAQVPEEL